MPVVLQPDASKAEPTQCLAALEEVLVSEPISADDTATGKPRRKRHHEIAVRHCTVAKIRIVPWLDNSSSGIAFEGILPHSGVVGRDANFDRMLSKQDWGLYTAWAEATRCTCRIGVSYRLVS